MSPRTLFLLALLVGPAYAESEVAATADTGPIAIETFLRTPMFRDMKISPDGRHLAASVPAGDDKTVLVVFDSASMERTALLGMRPNEHVGEFEWVSNDRLIVSAEKKDGWLDAPIATGELYGVNADGKNYRQLFGYRMPPETSSTHIRQAVAERASARVIDVLPDEDNHVLIEVVPWDRDEGTFNEVRRMDTRNGLTTKVVTAPIREAGFLTDADGKVRLSGGVRLDGNQEIYQRSASGGDWKLLHDESSAGYRMFLQAFHADGKRVYALVEEEKGPRSLQLLDLASGKLERIAADPVADISGTLFGARHQHLYAVASEPTLPRLHYVDEDSAEARFSKALENSFPGQFAYFTSFTSDGKAGLVQVVSDRNAGEFFFFNLETLRARLLGSSRQWLDPQRMAETRPIHLKSKDGLDLHGYLTLPSGGGDKNLPLIVNPHGGPHGFRDHWAFDEEVQLLASRGYAVLRVNFRGSGGYGGDFERAGYRHWADTMQDDVADAVRWAIAQGHADPERICIYGISYGAYAAMMNAARFPDLYQCAVGYAGVYDLRLVYSESDIGEFLYSRTDMERIIGREGLQANSPVSHAAKIKAPVMLIHGGADARTPKENAERMREALQEAGNEPEWLYERREGHGFYNMDNRIKLYTQLLAFLDRHIGAGASP